MQKQATIEENEIDWYISQNPIDRYIKVDNIDYQSDTKSVRKIQKGTLTGKSLKKNNDG